MGTQSDSITVNLLAMRAPVSTRTSHCQPDPQPRRHRRNVSARRIESSSKGLAFGCSCLAALAPGGLFLCSRAALGCVSAGARLLPPVLGCVRGVRDLGCTLLRHSLVLQSLVLLLVL